MKSVSSHWDKEYAAGMYKNEKPIKYATNLIKMIKNHKAVGLYVGCGNGRNYSMLAKSLVNLVGLDVSRVGIEQIKNRFPEYKNRLVCQDFLDHNGIYDYIVSIQSFQHGDKIITDQYFAKCCKLLKTGGVLHLRVNSSLTNILYRHEKIEKSTGAFTAVYLDGPKANMNIRFYSLKYLRRVLNKNGFKIINYRREIIPRRDNTSWSQWEINAIKI